MLEKIMHKGDEYFPNLVGKKVSIRKNTIWAVYNHDGSMTTDGSNIFHSDGAGNVINTMTARDTADQKSHVYLKLRDQYGDRNWVPLYNFLKNGGVFNSLLTHIKQAFRVSLLKRGALNA